MHIQSTSTSSYQVLCSKYHSPIKGTGFLGEKADSRVGIEKIQDEPGEACGAKK